MDEPLLLKSEYGEVIYCTVSLEAAIPTLLSKLLVRPEDYWHLLIFCPTESDLAHVAIALKAHCSYFL